MLKVTLCRVAHIVNSSVIFTINTSTVFALTVDLMTINCPPLNKLYSYEVIRRYAGMCNFIYV